jgi:hypothetical protein
MLPDNSVSIEDQCSSNHDLGFIKACCVLPEDAGMPVMDKMVTLAYQLQILINIHFYLVSAEEKSWFGCIG